MQEFKIRMDFDDGEAWEMTRRAQDPATALAGFTRRLDVAVALLSERQVRFTVTDTTAQDHGTARARDLNPTATPCQVCDPAGTHGAWMDRHPGERCGECGRISGSSTPEGDRG